MYGTTLHNCHNIYDYFGSSVAQLQPFALTYKDIESQKNINLLVVGSELWLGPNCSGPLSQSASVRTI